MFVAIVVPVAKKERAVLFVVLLSMLISIAFYYVPYIKNISSGFAIIITTIMVSAIAAWLFPKQDED